jgi:hypothetical protein
MPRGGGKTSAFCRCGPGAALRCARAQRLSSRIRFSTDCITSEERGGNCGNPGQIRSTVAAGQVSHLGGWDSGRRSGLTPRWLGTGCSCGRIPFFGIHAYRIEASPFTCLSLQMSRVPACTPGAQMSPASAMKRPLPVRRRDS